MGGVPRASGRPRTRRDPERAHLDRLAELAEREAVTGTLIAASPYAIFAMDSDRRLTEFNFAAEELTGYRREDVLGRDMTGLLVPNRERGRFRAHVKTFLATGDPGEFTGWIRVPVLCADGSERDVQLSPVQMTVRGRTTFWGIMRDLSEMERLQEERAQFLAVISHELRTPLTSIISFSELLRTEAAGLSADGLRFLDTIAKNADRLLRLVSDLLMLDRLEAGALPLELGPVSIPGLAGEAVRTAAPAAAKKGITIALEAGDGPALLGDARRLTQVLDNLIGNAIKFSDAGGQVRVTAAYAERIWRIDVSDTGIGIPQSEAHRLFGPFVRASNARIAGLPGTGLGLSIVRQIVDMHGGHVHVDSELDHGTTFSVFLPEDGTAAEP